jgi:hypothetical protein
MPVSQKIFFPRKIPIFQNYFKIFPKKFPFLPFLPFQQNSFNFHQTRKLPLIYFKNTLVVSKNFPFTKNSHRFPSSSTFCLLRLPGKFFYFHSPRSACALFPPVLLRWGAPFLFVVLLRPKFFPTFIDFHIQFGGSFVFADVFVFFSAVFCCFWLFCSCGEMRNCEIFGEGMIFEGKWVVLREGIKIGRD